MIGFYTKKKKILSSSHTKGLNSLFMNIILPCNIISSFQINIRQNIFREIIIVLIISIAYQFYVLLLSKFLYRGFEDSKKRVLEFSTICSSAGFIGIPVINGIFGSQGVFYGSFYLIPFRIFMWTFGLACFTNIEKKTVIKQLVLHPCIVAVYIGLGIMISGVSFPEAITNAISSVGDSTIAISMIIIGNILGDADLRTIFSKEIIYYSFFRLIAIPLSVAAILIYLNVDPLIAGISTVIAAMPASSSVAPLASEYGCDERFASKSVFLTVVFSIFTIPLISYVLMTLNI
jgi:hypothetical protein